MVVILQRLAFGCFWFAVIWVALIVICGGVASSLAGAQPPANQPRLQKSHSHGYDSSLAAGVEFRERYGHYVVLAAAVLAAAGTLAGVLPGTRRPRSR